MPQASLSMILLGLSMLVHEFTLCQFAYFLCYQNSQPGSRLKSGATYHLKSCSEATAASC